MAAAVTRQRPRQAVIIIHGIGEQRPLDTLRSFVRGDFGQEGDGIVSDTDAFHSATDDLHQRTDQRKVKVTWNHQKYSDLAKVISQTPDELAESREANTDFYEYYWAYHFRDTRFGHLSSWLRPLLTRRRRFVSNPRILGPRARVARPALAIAVLVLAIALVWVGKSTPSPGLLLEVVVALLFMVTTAGILALASALGILSFARMAALSLLVPVGYVAGRLWQFGTDPISLLRGLALLPAAATMTGIPLKLLSSIGDAARYFTVSPDNVQVTEEIRATAVNLLERLHDMERESGIPLYERLVVVGHSLGSVIAYDAVRFLWARRRKDMILPAKTSKDIRCRAPADVEQRGAELDATDSELEDLKAGAKGSSDTHMRIAQLDGAHGAFWAAKERLYEQLRDPEPIDFEMPRRAAHDRWIISDLVTLGSPLTYADVLLARSNGEFEHRKSERAYATDPPSFQGRGGPHSMRYRSTKPVGAGRVATSHFHHAAVFAAVKWTNIYYPHDLVGGPLAPMFGPGIKDIELAGPGPARIWKRVYLTKKSHTQYWKKPSAPHQIGANRCVAELRAIIGREPEVLVRVKDPPPFKQIEQLSDLLEQAHDPVGFAVRLLVGENPPTGAWLPGGARIILDHDLKQKIETILDSGSTYVCLGVSPDIRPLGSRFPEDEPENVGSVPTMPVNS